MSSTTPFQVYTGKELRLVADSLEKTARAHGLRVNVQDPTFNSHNIDVETDRLNVMVDEDYVIRSFKIG